MRSLCKSCGRTAESTWTGLWQSHVLLHNNNFVSKKCVQYFGFYQFLTTASQRLFHVQFPFLKAVGATFSPLSTPPTTITIILI